MKRLAAVLTALPLFGVITFNSSKALADAAVLTSISTVLTLYPTSDAYNYYNGYVTTTDGKAFFWGGSTCSPLSYKLSPTEIQTLTDAAISKRTVAIYYKPSASTTPCITGIVVYSAPSNTSNSNSVQPPSLPQFPKK
jgi:hypothetical protein